MTPDSAVPMNSLSWSEANQRYLTLSLERLRALLEGGAAGEPAPASGRRPSPARSTRRWS